MVHATHVGCLGCGAGLPVDGPQVQTCEACGRTQRLDQALYAELALHRERLARLAEEGVDARLRVGLAKASRVTLTTWLLIAGPFVVAGLAWASDFVWNGLQPWFCAGGGLLYLAWFAWLGRESALQWRRDASRSGPDAPQRLRCPTCGGPTLAGAAHGAPCPSCGTPVLATAAARDLLEVVEEDAVRTEQALARALTWRLQARQERHRHEDLAPWIAFVLCFGAIPLAGPVAVGLGMLAGNYSVLGGLIAISTCIAIGVPLVAWPAWRALAIHRLQAELDALPHPSSRDADGLVTWLETHWTGALPETLFRQGRQWAWVELGGGLLVLNLRRVNRTHPCQPHLWVLVPEGATCPQIEGWSCWPADPGTVVEASPEIVRRWRRIAELGGLIGALDASMETLESA